VIHIDANQFPGNPALIEELPEIARALTGDMTEYTYRLQDRSPGSLQQSNHSSFDPSDRKTLWSAMQSRS
jgi:hypothetical protein